MDISQLPKGALPDKEDLRDFQAEPVMGAAQVDWTKEFRLPEPPDEDQGQSLSCVSQSWSYYHWQLHGKDYSRKDLYSRIFLPQGGAYIRDGGLQIVKNGQATRDEVPDPKPETEDGMRAGAGTPQQEADDKELNSFVIGSNTIDACALAIQQYQGVVFGVIGTNEGWQDLTNPRPPQDAEQQWSHALYGMGFHSHAGVKCIIAKSSWCSVVREHHIKANYFVSRFTVNPWTLIPRKDIMSQIATQALGSERRIILKAATQEQWKALCAVYGKDPDKVEEQVWTQ